MAYSEYEALKKKFGQKIRALRQSKGLSQEELADQAGLNRNYVGEIERGEKNLSLRNIHRFSTALKVDMSALFKNLD